MRRRPTFTLEQIRTFVAVAESEHVSRAANSLYLTQAAVTQQVRNFEQAVGLQLFERDGRRVRLTDAGRSLAETCRAALRAVEVIDDSAQSMKQLEAGSLHIGASPTCATYYVPPYLAEFTRRYPAVRLSMLVEPTAELNRKVLSGTLDCAVIEGPPDPGLITFELSRDELLLVAHPDHPLSRLRKVGPADFKRHRYLRRGPQWSAERHVRDMLGESYDQVEAIDLGHPEYVRAAAVAGLGFAALSRRAVANDLASGLLKRLPVQPIGRAISAVRRQGRGGPAQEAFWEMLVHGHLPASAKMPTDGRSNP
ncbi:MAG TPA: LysR family transcriptional regulator [Candidatus Dormibacteraeota bacterium]|nr:LysR family transcriptional regulator [Candidatus Dormibacteraeota bacterium]